MPKPSTEQRLLHKFNAYRKNPQQTITCLRFSQAVFTSLKAHLQNFSFKLSCLIKIKQILELVQPSRI